MNAHTVCLRCHQKCHLNAEVVEGRIVCIEDASPVNRTPPCTEACPLGMDVRGYVMAISRGRFNEAMEIIRDTNPLPLTCGRVCHHPCEMECNRIAVDYKPVAIRGLKRLVADHALRLGDMPSPPERTKKESVAIIGSGPAGLTAACDLVRAGYGATVYEATPAAGGMPSAVIPEFKLPRAMVQADIDSITDLGVEIKLNSHVGIDPSLDELLERHDAVLVAIGCWKPLPLDIPGSGVNGIYYAMPLLQAVNEGEKIHLHGKVIVIGGGDTAMAAARAALRLGAGEAKVTCLEERKAMPAHDWEIEKAEGEGVTIHPGLAPQRFRSNDASQVAGVDLRSVASLEVNTEGRLVWSLQQGPESEHSLDANAVIVAIGQTTSPASLQAPALRLSSQGTIAVDPGSMACDTPGLFAAGDCVTGPSTIVEAMAAGRRAASSIIKYLGGEEPKFAPPRQFMQEDLSNSMVRTRRHEMPALLPTEAVRSFQEVELGYTEETGIEEARRCLNCTTNCIKGATIPDVMYHPDRLLYPLKRAGKRGEGRWERISWDEAIGAIAGKLKEIKDRYGPEAIHVSCGSGQKHIGIQATKIAERLWPTPNTHLGRYTCIHPDVMANTVTFGDSVTYEFGPDYGHAACIVFWGSDPDVATPQQARVIKRALRAGAKMIVIDPRPIPMAKRADLWLRIRPGTDMALGLAMQHVIINEGLYDKEFVERWCEGFEKLREHVQVYSPEWAANVTGLSREEIIAAARMYSTTTPGCIYVRLGSGAQQVTSTQTSRAISILVGITGNVDRRGGNLLFHRTFRESLFWTGYDLFGGVKPPASVNARRIGALKYPLMNKMAVCDIPGTVQAMEQGRVRALWCVANNLLAAEMDSRRIWEIMKEKLEFIFVSDFFMTPTAELADIVLPAAFYPECDLLVEAFAHPSSYVTAASRIVEPLGECKDDREVAIEIAKAMGMDVRPWESLKDFLNWRLKYQGVTYDEMCKRPRGRITYPRKYKRYKHSMPPFSTPSGKVELYSSIFEAMSVDPLPVFHEPPQSPVSTPELFQEFPLIYTHRRSHGYQHSEGRQIQRQRRLEPDPYLEISCDTAVKLGIREGDWITLETPQSQGQWNIRFRARLVEDMHPEVVAGTHEWWLPEQPGPEHGCFDSNINAVLTLDPPYDPLVGVPQCRAVLCRIMKAQGQQEEG